MMINETEGVNVVPSGIKIIQFSPETIPLYLVQENELLMVAQGGDTLAQQICLTAAGAFIGALPGAFVGAVQFSKDGKIEMAYLIALVVCVAGLIVSIACASIHRRQKTYPEKMLDSILSRKTTSTPT